MQLVWFAFVIERVTMLQLYAVLIWVGVSMWRRVVLSILFACLCCSASVVASPIAWRIHWQGAIGPVAASYIDSGLQQAQQRHARVVILQMDTPGGLSTSMRRIIKSILGSPIPVVGYVAPAGARAASAGTYILYACDIAAMATGTHLGAATPVALGAGAAKSKSGPADNASGKKAMNDARAYIRSLAQLRGRNQQWAEQAVTSAATLTAQEAKQKNVIDLIADSLPSLLQQLNGKLIKRGTSSFRLNTVGLQVVSQTMDWQTKFLQVITSPSVAYILLMIGIYGLFFEFAHPGLILPGLVGAVALFIGLYALHLLPINYAGLALMILGIACFMAEAFMPSFGILGIGGLVSFAIGSVMLIRLQSPAWGISPYWVAVMSVGTGLFFLGMSYFVLRTRHRPQQSGVYVLLGQTGVVYEANESLWLMINGEHWQIANASECHVGQTVVVLRVEGSQLVVHDGNHDRLT